MQYRRLGTSGLKVSAVSLGGWLTFGRSVSDDVTRQIVTRAVDGGVNFIDLADAYAHGEAERVFGRILKDHRRSHLVLSSKLYWPMSDDPNDRGLGRKHIVESVEGTLRRLGTDYLDLYFCHREDAETPLEETARAMDDLVHQGKVLYWGTSMYRPSTLLKLHALCQLRGLYRPAVEQPVYNLLDRHIERRLMATVRHLGMGLVVWSPLAGGVLTGKYDQGIPAGSRGDQSDWVKDYLTQENLERVRALASVADELGVTRAQLALSWLLTRRDVSSVIIGATRPEHVSSNLKAVELTLPSDVIARVDQLFRR